MSEKNTRWMPWIGIGTMLLAVSLVGCDAPEEREAEVADAVGVGEQTEQEGLVRRYSTLAAGINNCGIYRYDHQEGTFASCGSRVREDNQEVEFSYVDAWNVTSCGLRADNGQLHCWGMHVDEEDWTTSADGDFDVAFESITLGDRSACGLDADGQISCLWFTDHFDERPDVATPPEGRFTRLAGGQTNFCGIDEGGSIHCWGDDRLEMSDPPAGSFVDLSLGQYGGCAVAADDGSLACWGREQGDGGMGEPPEGAFQAVAYNSTLACALDVDGRAHCWGSSDEGLNPPDVELSAVSSNRSGQGAGIEAGSGLLVTW